MKKTGEEKNNLTFADFVHKRRVSLGYTLREFCRKTGYDVAYISRIENGLMTPPDDINKLKALALALELKPESEEWVEFFDSAYIERGKIPKDIIESKLNVINFLPAFYRTIRSKKLTQEDLDRLTKLLKQKDNEEKHTNGNKRKSSQ